jgi:hypothetical protein
MFFDRAAILAVLRSDVFGMPVSDEGYTSPRN